MQVTVIAMEAAPQKKDHGQKAQRHLLQVEQDCCDPADQPEGPPRSNSPKVLGRLPGALPGKIGVLGGVPEAVLGELPGGVLRHCREDCREAAPPAVPAVPRAVPPACSRHSPQHPDFPRQCPRQSPQQFGELDLGGPSGRSAGSQSKTAACCRLEMLRDFQRDHLQRFGRVLEFVLETFLAHRA